MTNILPEKVHIGSLTPDAVRCDAVRIFVRCLASCKERSYVNYAACCGTFTDRMNHATGNTIASARSSVYPYDRSFPLYLRNRQTVDIELLHVNKS